MANPIEKALAGCCIYLTSEMIVRWVSPVPRTSATNDQHPEGRGKDESHSRRVDRNICSEVFEASCNFEGMNLTGGVRVLVEISGKDISQGPGDEGRLGGHRLVVMGKEKRSEGEQSSLKVNLIYIPHPVGRPSCGMSAVRQSNQGASRRPKMERPA